MLRIIYLAISLAAFLSGLLCAVFVSKKRKAVPKAIIGCLMAGTAVAMLPLYLNGNRDAPGGLLDSTITSVLGVIRSMTGENSVFDTREMLGVVPAELQAFTAIYTAILHLTSAALLLGFLLSLFKNFFPWMRYHLFTRGRLCVFTELSERGLLLAEDIRRQDEVDGRKKAAIVFLDKLSEEDSEGSSKLERLNSIGAFLFDTSVHALKLHKRYLKEPVNFFLMRSNEEENLRDGLELAAEYGKSALAGHLRVHILNAQPEAEAVVDSIEYTSKLSLRLIREARSTLYHLFDTRPLFLGERNGKLVILVVGAGRNGTEAIKIASWCGQTLKLRPEILVVDNDPTVESRFERECPELAPRTAPPDALADCTIRFLTADVKSGAFSALLKKYPDVGYVICALGNAELNLRTSMNIRRVYEEIRFSNPQPDALDQPPMVNVLLENPFLFGIGSRLKFDTRVDCDLAPFGSLKQTYTWNNIVSPYLENAGVAVNRFYARHYQKASLNALSPQERAKQIAEIEYSADRHYEEKEYHRGSSVALGLHCKYKIYACLQEAEGLKLPDAVWLEHPDQSIIESLQKSLASPQNGAEPVEALSQLEHRRWNAYMRSEGWRCATTEVADRWFETLQDHRNFAAKLHPCLVTWDELVAIDRWLAERHNKESDFQELDRIMVRALPEILA